MDSMELILNSFLTVENSQKLGQQAPSQISRNIPQAFKRLKVVVIQKPGKVAEQAKRQRPVSCITVNNVYITTKNNLQQNKFTYA